MSEATKHATDAETLQFMADLEASIQQAQAGEFARVTSGEEIARRTRGRPPAVALKAPVTLRLDAQALALWRASGKGWQTRAAAALAAAAPRVK
jgi:uncharacterized protein (DUF4415 family)